MATKKKLDKEFFLSGIDSSYANKELEVTIKCHSRKKKKAAIIFTNPSKNNKPTPKSVRYNICSF